MPEPTSDRISSARKNGLPPEVSTTRPSSSAGSRHPRAARRRARSTRIVRHGRELDHLGVFGCRTRPRVGRIAVRPGSSGRTGARCREPPEGVAGERGGGRVGPSGGPRPRSRGVRVRRARGRTCERVRARAAAGSPATAGGSRRRPCRASPEGTARRRREITGMQRPYPLPCQNTGVGTGTDPGGSSTTAVKDHALGAGSVRRGRAEGTRSAPRATRPPCPRREAAGSSST
jgi:hypothetical protein